MSHQVLPQRKSSQPTMLLRYASYAGSGADPRRPDSRPGTHRKIQGIEESLDETKPSYEDMDAKEGRKFLLQQKFPEKHLSKQRRMSSVITKERAKELPIQLQPTMTTTVQSFGAISDDGFNASYNQDALLSTQNINNVENTAMFGVFDGHGVGGDQVAMFAKDMLYKNFTALYGSKGKPDSEIPEILVKSFLETQESMEKTGNQFLLAGTTSSIVFIQNHKLFIAHVGDSRVVLGRECVNCALTSKMGATDESHTRLSAHIAAISTTIDHRVGEILEERLRVERCGGSVIMDPNLPPDALDELRIYAKGQTYPGLVTTRTLGDVLAHGLGVISNPEISSKDIDEYDKVIILASDGVWDILSSQEAVNLVIKYEDPVEATNALIAECVKGWSDEYDTGDNVSAVVIFLNPLRLSDKNFPTCKKSYDWGSVREGKDLKVDISKPSLSPVAGQDVEAAEHLKRTSASPSPVQASPAASKAQAPSDASGHAKAPRSNLCTIL